MKPRTIQVSARDATRKIGLARTLSKLGYCSRSSAAELIRAGRVSLNGSVYRDPEIAVLGDCHKIAVDGIPVESGDKVYLMLNKPRSVITTAFDEQGRDTVYTTLSPRPAARINSAQPWVAPVGRLDKASEGLLLLTNDSVWAARITAPETHLEKTYHVQVSTVADSNFLRSLIQGVRTGDNQVLRARQARLLRSGQKNCWLEIILDEGKNRQIRRMIGTMNIEVLRLIRVAIGPLQLGRLPKGGNRPLTGEEKRQLDRAMRRHES